MSKTIGDVILDVNNISLSFGGVKALTDISFNVREHEIRAIIGPNGAGKSSMLNCINGVYQPQQGTINFRGQTFRHMNSRQVAEMGIARTFQNLALFKGMSVLDNILLGRHVHMKPGVLRTALYWWLARQEETQHRQVVEEIIRFMQLESVRMELVDSIPIGLKKRVELARALVAEPSFLILDEPMAGMNQEEKEYMARFVLDARDERGVTVLLIEHHMDVITGICDRMLVLSYGEMIGTGIPSEVIADPRVVKAYLGAAHVPR